MILVLEILLTVYGIMMMVRRKGMGKEAVKHPSYLWLGLFSVTVLPAAFALVFLAGIIVAIANQGQDVERVVEDNKWIFIVTEIGTVVLYAIIVSVLDARIKKKALATQSTQSMFDRFPAPKP